MRMVGCGKIRVFLLSLGWILINTAIAHNVHVSLATIDAGISPKASAISTLKNEANQSPKQANTFSIDFKTNMFVMNGKPFRYNYAQG